MIAACSAVPDTSGIGNGIASALDVTPLLSPYRIDVRQGNLVTQEMVAQLKPGLSREQVRFILGTPLLTDVFHADRWDYVYRFQPGSGDAQQRRLTVFFADGKLARVAGDVAEAAATATAPKPASRMIEIKGPETAPDAAPADAAADAAALPK